MSEFIITNELTIRLFFFFGILLLMALWEVLAPRRPLLISKRMRWTGNLSLVLINTVLLRLLFPAAAVGLAIFVQSNNWGLLNHYEISPGLAFIVSLLFLDLVIYLQHVMFHALPVLWRLHRVHHADLDFDVTTGLRFHPIEIILSMLIKFVAIIVLGPSVLAVLVFEVLLNSLAMFNHGNVRMPLGIDRVLRWFIVTPDMHRVHHSVEDYETNSNFGFNLSLWDRLFGTYIAQPQKGHEDMLIGIHHYNNPEQLGKIAGLLLFPFKGKVQGYAINRRQWTQDDKQDNS